MKQCGLSFKYFQSVWRPRVCGGRPAIHGPPAAEYMGNISINMVNTMQWSGSADLQQRRHIIEAHSYKENVSFLCV